MTILGRPGVEVDRAVGRHQVLRGGHEAVARADDLVHPRHGLGPVGECRHRLGPADPEESRHARFEGCSHDDGVRPRARDDHLGDPRGTRRDRGHQERRWQRVPAGRNVAPHAVQRHHALGHSKAGVHVDPRRGRALALGHAADVRGGGLQCASHVARNTARRLAHLILRHFQGALETVEPAGVAAECRVAALPDRSDDRRDGPADRRLPGRPPVQDTLHFASV